MTDLIEPAVPAPTDDDAPEPTPIRRGFSTSGNGRNLTPKPYRRKVRV